MSAKGNSKKQIMDSKQMSHVIENMKEGTIFLLTCTGWSMTPTFIHKKTILTMKVGKPKKLRRGQVLLFRREDGKLVLHRVHKVQSDEKLIMNGDRQDWTEKIHTDQILGYMISFRRRGEKDKSIASNDISYKIWSFFWQSLKPIRPMIFRVRGVYKTFR